MQTNTTTTANTAALIAEFFDGIGYDTHTEVDGNVVHIRNEANDEITVVAEEEIAVITAYVMAAAGNTEENRTDWSLLLDRWDFSE